MTATPAAAESRRHRPAGPRTASVPVLMYHALSPAASSAFRRWTIEPARFEEHLAFLAEQGFRTSTVGSLRVDGPPAERAVVLTFDDAFADFAEVALPLLDRYGMTATLYVPTDYVGGRSGWMQAEGEGDRAVLSWSQLSEVAAAGIEIGAHSHTHPELDRLSDADLADEVQRPKALLEDRLELTVDTFAYPYGDYDRRVRDAVVAAGYRSAVTMNSWAATGVDHPAELPRLAVLDSTDLGTLERRLVASGNRVRRSVLRSRRAVDLLRRRGGTRRDRRRADEQALR